VEQRGSEKITWHESDAQLLADEIQRTFNTTTQHLSLCVIQNGLSQMA
jgi:hypothetical protein